MTLEDLGYNDKLEKLRKENNLNEFEVGRVISEHKERYIVRTEKGEFEAEITGNLRFSSKSREDFPAVGDWVAITIHDSDFSSFNEQTVSELFAIGAPTSQLVVALFTISSLLFIAFASGIWLLSGGKRILRAISYYDSWKCGKQLGIVELLSDAHAWNSTNIYRHDARNPGNKPIRSC